MALQVRELTQLIAHKIDSDATAAMSPIAIVNEAGRFLVSLRTWNFQLRPSYDLALVSAQTYIALPPDYGAMEGVPVANPGAARIRVLQMMSFQQLLDLRGTLTPSSNIDGSYAGAIVWVPNVSVDGGPPTPRIEIWPAPNANDTKAFLLAYYGDWEERTTDEQFVNLPEYAEGLMRHLVRETAAGYENDDQASVWERVGAIKASDIFQAVVTADSRVQVNFGTLQGGAAARVAAMRSSAGSSAPFWPVHI